jgi:hypothetical protein
MSKRMRPTVVTILSTNYAGSHFVSLLLGSHSQAVHLDEVRHLIPCRRGRRVDCQICESLDDCPLLRNIDPAHIDQVYSTILANLAEDGEHPLAMIDTSKKISWARRFIGDRTFRYQYIHLIRDPRALVRRWMLTHGSTQAALHLRRKAALRGVRFQPQLLWAPQWKVCAYKWLHENQKITSFLKRHELDYQVVTYHDASADSIGQTRRLMEWIGLSPESEQVQYWKFRHHMNADKAGKLSITKLNKAGTIDLRWREFLPQDVSDAVVSNKDILSYLAGLSLEVIDEGLRHKPVADSEVDSIPMIDLGDRGRMAA